MVIAFLCLPSVMRRTAKWCPNSNTAQFQRTADSIDTDAVFLADLFSSEPGKIFGAKDVIRSQPRLNPRTCNNFIGSQPAGDCRRRYTKTRGQQWRRDATLVRADDLGYLIFT